MSRCIAADVLVGEAVAYHVDSHVGGRLVGILTVDALEEGVQHWEYFDVAVVVDRGTAIGLQMERVDHVDIVQIGRGSLVS